MSNVDTSGLITQLTEKYNAAIIDEEFTKDPTKISKAITGLTYSTKESRRRKQLMVTVRKQLMGEREKEFRSSGTYRPVEDIEVIELVEAKLKE